MLRTITKALLILNGIMLAFVGLWLLVGGSNRGYFGGGAVTEVDGILFLFLALFNVSFLLAAFLVLAWSGPGKPLPPEAAQLLNKPPAEAEAVVITLMRKWAGWGLMINALVLLFVGLWLLMNTERGGYFRSNATSVDMVVLLLLSVLNIGHMGLMKVLPTSMLARAE